MKVVIFRLRILNLFLVNYPSNIRSNKITSEYEDLLFRLLKYFNKYNRCQKVFLSAIKANGKVYDLVYQSSGSNKLILNPSDGLLPSYDELKTLLYQLESSS